MGFDRYAGEFRDSTLLELGCYLIQLHDANFPSAWELPPECMCHPASDFPLTVPANHKELHHIPDFRAWETSEPRFRNANPANLPLTRTRNGNRLGSLQ